MSDSQGKNRMRGVNCTSTDVCVGFHSAISSGDGTSVFRTVRKRFPTDGLRQKPGPPVSVEAENGGHLLVTQLEVKDLKVVSYDEGVTDLGITTTFLWNRIRTWAVVFCALQ